MKIDLLRFSPVFAALYRAWVRSVRFDDGGKWDRILEEHARGTPIVNALWHNELFSMAGYGSLRGGRYVLMASQSKDGELIARILQTFGHEIVRGSSSRGGLRALLGCVRQMRDGGRMGVFTVDGPRGPIYEVKDGVIFAAQRAGALVFPLRAFPARKMVFEKSWDRFQVPYPFTRCLIRVGEPYRVTEEKLEGEVMEREKKRLHDRLMALAPED